MRERIQKLLAARGVGSRRQVEGWIAAGRITVNGKSATPGQAVAERDDIRLDGRRLRLKRAAETPHQGVIYHRPALEEVRSIASGSARSSLERLPKAGGRRWIAVSPLASRDGGLELFLTDGKLAAALTRRGLALSSEFSVRVRGSFDDAAIESQLQTRAATAHAEGRIIAVTPSGGEGSNRWLQVEVSGLRPRDLRALLADCGLETNRILRTRLGPLAMDRSLARGRSRALSDGELRALRDAAGPRATGSRSPPR
jgi:23S rRNA pseudouridine2605 synthase